ncbi:MAG: hypothetical protein ACRDKV_10815, partial [Solirubrobacterales bacterium]
PEPALGVGLFALEGLATLLQRRDLHPGAGEALFQRVEIEESAPGLRRQAVVLLAQTFGFTPEGRRIVGPRRRGCEECGDHERPDSCEPDPGS